MKRALIIHGWESHSKDHWYQEEKVLLEDLGYEAVIPEMPNTFLPNESEWVSVINNFNPTAEDILIGHSLGAPTILRYLENAENKVDKVFLIAGFASPLNLDYPNAEYPGKFVERDFNWDKIKNNYSKIYIINQKDDPWVPKEKGEEIANMIGEKIILVDGDNHFDEMDLDIINDKLA